MSSFRAIESTDVIRLIAQFLSEQNLPRTREALLSETGVPVLDTSVTLDTLANDCRNGRCKPRHKRPIFTSHSLTDSLTHTGDAVLSATADASLDAETRTDLYAHIMLELCDTKDIDAATALLRHSPPLARLRKSDAARFAFLESQLTAFDPLLAYGGAGDIDAKAKRRKAIAKALCRQVRVAPPGRLLALLAQALQWQQFRGLLPPAGQPYDLFADVALAVHAEPATTGAAGDRASAAAAAATTTTAAATRNTVAHELSATVKFGKNRTPMCAAFSPDGESLVSGSSDGFVEIWHARSGKLRRDLTYQANDDILMHDCAVLCVAFSVDSELLASGDSKGQLKVWHVPGGKIVRRFERAHQQAILSAEFLRDGTRVVTCSQDESVCVHGLQSGATLKVLRGHTSFVNDIALLRDAHCVASVGTDGTVRVWDLRTSTCAHQFELRVDGDERGVVAPISSICTIPDTDDHLLLCNRSATLFVTTLGGRVLRTLVAETSHASEVFVSCSVGTTNGAFVYAVSDRGNLYSFELATGKLQYKVAAHEGECLGMAQHPHDALIATVARNDSKLKLWS
jgi:WD40 repeat-containing protein SMU1